MLNFLFPGQGSQFSGMGRALADAYPAAKAVFEEADDALGMSLSDLCFEGSEEELKRTEVTQPAILTTSVAVLRALQSERPDLKPSYAAGHSLGEFSALVAVGALAFADAVKLVQTRGRLMQSAVPEGEGAMAAIIGLPAEAVVRRCEAVARESGAAVAAANFNSEQQTVISGSAEGVRLASEALLSDGAGKAVPLPVSAPFHSSLMEPAARGLAEALEPIEVGPMSAPVVTNVHASPNQDASAVKALLVEQVTAPVRWVESMRALVAAGSTACLELGPGKVLMGLARRIDRSLKVTPIQDPDGLKKALAKLPS